MIHDANIPISEWHDLPNCEANCVDVGHVDVAHHHVSSSRLMAMMSESGLMDDVGLTIETSRKNPGVRSGN